MAYRSTGPQVYDYNRDSYDPYRNPNTTTHHTQDVTHNTVHTHSDRPIVNTATHSSTVPTSELRGSQTRLRGSKYDQYKHKIREYKYNLFSIIDEPWNRCCEVGKCGTCPGNECVAKREPVKDWL